MEPEQYSHLKPNRDDPHFVSPHHPPVEVKPQTWLSQFAQLLEKLDFSGAPQSRTYLRQEMSNPHSPGMTYAYSLSGALTAMYVSHCGISPSSEHIGWKNSGFNWVEPDIGMLNHPGVVCELPSPVLWWALTQPGGLETAMMVMNCRSTLSFKEAAVRVRSWDKALSQAEKRDFAMATRHTPDQTMKNTLRIQQRAKPKPRAKYDF